MTEIKNGDTFYIRTPDGLVEFEVTSTRPERRTKAVGGQWREVTGPGAGFEAIVELSSIGPPLIPEDEPK